jgi:hypothetical protein
VKVTFEETQVVTVTRLQCDWCHRFWQDWEGSRGVGPRSVFECDGCGKHICHDHMARFYSPDNLNRDYADFEVCPDCCKRGFAKVHALALERCDNDDLLEYKKEVRRYFPKPATEESS